MVSEPVLTVWLEKRLQQEPSQTVLGECSSSAGALCFTNAKLASIHKAEVCCCV